MLGRAASLPAGRKENRWPAGGRGSRVGPHSGLDPDFFQDPGPSASAVPPRHTASIYLGQTSIHFRESWELGGGGELGEGKADRRDPGSQQRQQCWI